MAQDVARGQIWLLRLSRPDKRRPVVVLSRDRLLRVLQTATVAAISSARRGAPTEVDLGVDDGLKHDCCVNLANVFTVRQTELHHFVGSLSEAKMRQVCAALAIAFDCDTG